MANKKFWQPNGPLLAASTASGGGEGGIRPPGTLTGTDDFESTAIDLSATSPTLRHEHLPLIS